MTCTLTAVPYAQAATVSRGNAFQNPRGAGGVATWSYYPGASGAAALSAQSLAAPPIADTGEALPSMHRLFVQWTVASTGPGGLYWESPAGSVVPGTAYTASVYAVSAPAVSIRCTIEWLTAAGASLGVAIGAYVPTSGAANGYARLSASGVAPASASKARVAFYSQTALPVGAVLAYTCALFEAGAALLPYFDGATLAPVGSLDAWSGTPHASWSSRTTRTVAPGGSVNSTPSLVLDYSAPRESASVEHPILGRPDPVHAVGPLRTRKGSLELFYPTLALARAAERLHEASRVMLRDTEFPELDMYYVPRTVALAPTQERTATQRWRLSVDYTEVYATAGLY